MYGQMCIEKRYVWTDVYRKEICMDRCVKKRDMYGQMCIEKRYVWTDVYRKEICMDRCV